MNTQASDRKGSSIRWALVLCTVGPAAALGVYALSGGLTTPASAGAAPAKAPERVAKIDLPQPSEAHRSLLAANDATHKQPIARSPMVEPAPAAPANPAPHHAAPTHVEPPAVKPAPPTPTEPEPTEPEPLPVEDIPLTPDFTLTSILRLGGSSAAIVNGKRRVVGDEVVDGWSVKVIDADAGSVTLVGPKDLEVTVAMKRYGGK